MKLYGMGVETVVNDGKVRAFIDKNEVINPDAFLHYFVSSER